jgi:flagellar biosynthesis protein FlhG
MNWGTTPAISIAGGKGGIGKSSFTANLGLAFAQTGKRVVLLDADIGGANLHTMVGVSRPTKTLSNFFNDPAVTLESVVVPTPYPNLRLLSSADDLLSVVSPNYRAQQRLYKEIQSLHADLFMIDIAAGTDRRAIDFFTIAPIGIIIVELVPTSLENAFLFIKNLLMRYLLRVFYRDMGMRQTIQKLLDTTTTGHTLTLNELLDRVAQDEPDKIESFRKYFTARNYRMCMVVNSVRNLAQLPAVEKFAKIVKRYLDINLQIIGTLPYESLMDEAIGKRMPFVARYPDSGYMQSVQQIMKNLPV